MSGAGSEDTRAGLLAQLRAGRRWDVVVIGGGATGLGCAVDAASRGYSVLLLEAHDFGKGTSSRATKLIHGGVRYLAQGRLGLVREALLERSRLLENAPHLVRPQRFVVPVYRQLDRLRYGVGLKAYGWLAGRHRIAPAQMLSAAELARAFPTVRREHLLGGIAYWDAQFDDARLAIALMRTVLDLGGVALNYLPVEGLLQEGGRVAGVRARDAEGDEPFSIPARVVINATGVWADRVRRLESPRKAPMLRPSQGVHVVVDASFLPGGDAVLVPETPDGRVLFMVPWQGRVILGTTDTPRDDLPLEPEPIAGEIELILTAVARYLRRPPTRADFRSVFAGLRPLIGRSGRGDTAGLSREHVVEVSSGRLVTITGGKWTTYRKMAEDAVDAAGDAAGFETRPCVTAGLKLHGDDSARPDEAAQMPRSALEFSDEQLRYAIRHEGARCVEDVLARRMRVLFLDAALAAQLAPRVARAMAEELGRDEAWVAAQTQAFQALAAHYLPREPGRR